MPIILRKYRLEVLKIIYPLRLVLLILFEQLVSISISYSSFDSREILILLCWIPVFTLPFLFTKKKIFLTFSLCVFFIAGFLNLAHLFILKGPIAASSLFVLLNTNMDEAKEFMELKFNFLMILIIPYILIFIWGLRKPAPVINTPYNKYILGFFIILPILFIAENTINGRLVRKGLPHTAKALCSFANEIKTFHALKKRKVITIPAKLISETTKQQVFVLIIGESSSRNHMSAYGYIRKTNPRLEKRKDIILYSNVVSPHSNTLYSILTFLTESNLENNKKYHKSLSIIDIFHSAGFKTYWISNQSPIGIWDNGIYNFAKTCDYAAFLNYNANSSFENNVSTSFDERLFSPVNTKLNDKAPYKLIIVHLMGSHIKYSKRYPERFKIFKNEKSAREQDINEYDNSVLYTDFVIDSMFSILNSYSLKNPDALCTAVYLSDHGENLYDENNAVGHDYNRIIPKSNVEIPYIVWLSQLYTETYKDKVSSMKRNKDLPFVSDDLFHAVIDLNAIECKTYEPKRSVFNSGFNFKRLRILADTLDYDLKTKHP